MIISYKKYLRNILLRHALSSPYVFILATIIIGSFSSNYDHIRHTISRLSISEYGWIQTINMLQLVVGLVAIGRILTTSLKNVQTQITMRISMYISAATMFLLAIVPTSPVDTSRFSELAFTINGFAHLALVFVFLLLTPVGIYHLYVTFKKDSDMKSYAHITLALGLLALFLSIIWCVFFYVGLFNEYRGIFQKAIALVVFLWLITINNKLKALALRDGLA
jgi:hypothetical protein